MLALVAQANLVVGACHLLCQLVLAAVAVVAVGAEWRQECPTLMEILPSSIFCRTAGPGVFSGVLCILSNRIGPLHLGLVLGIVGRRSRLCKHIGCHTCGKSHTRTSCDLRSGDGERRVRGLGQNEYGVYEYLHIYGPVPSFLIGLPQELACPRPPTPADSKYLYLVCFKDAQRSQTASRSVLAHSQVSRLWVKRE